MPALELFIEIVCDSSVINVVLLLSLGLLPARHGAVNVDELHCQEHFVERLHRARSEDLVLV